MRFPLVAPLGSHIPFLDRILRCNFHRASQPETTSHAKGKFRDTASTTPPIRKAHPTPHASGHGAISLLGLPSIKGRPPGGVFLHESHRMVRKKARVRLVAVLQLAIHPTNARDRIIENRLVIRMMEDVAPNACHGAPSCQQKSLENFEAFTSILFRAQGDAPTRPKRPFLRLQPCCPDLPWWGDPLRQPSCRAAS